MHCCCQWLLLAAAAICPQTAPDDFVVRSAPLAVQHSTTFATYPHDLPPFTVS